MKKVGVLIAGNGHLDGAEIREAVLTLLEIDRQGAESICIAPNRNQHHVVNHLTGEEMPEQRNIAVEAARIARGNIQFLENVDVTQLDALIIPGGFGCAKNLCSFAFKGAEADVSEDVFTFIRAIHKSQKPIGAICVSPALIALSLKEFSPTITLGPDSEPNEEISKTGAFSEPLSATDIVVDEKNKIVSTPAYMNGNESISNVSIGISKCVQHVLKWA